MDGKGGEGERRGREGEEREGKEACAVVTFPLQNINDIVFKAVFSLYFADVDEIYRSNVHVECKTDWWRFKIFCF